MKRSYRLVCKKAGEDKFFGVQYLHAEVINGGNIIYHICYWDIVKEQRDYILSTIERRYPQHEFKMLPISQ